MHLRDKMGYLEALLLHPVRHNTFAGKLDSELFNISDRIIFEIFARKILMRGALVKQGSLCCQFHTLAQGLTPNDTVWSAKDYRTQQA